MANATIPGFRSVANTGVIYVVQRANALGFSTNHAEWANLGQGSPETGQLDNAPARVTTCKIDTDSCEYSPVSGSKALRQRVADYYNTMFRQRQKTQYTWENVSIAGGGRQALSRLVAALGNVNMGHFLPDYTAYEELLSTFKAFSAIPILLEPENNYRISVDLLKKEILGRGLRALLISNPCNPTGQLIEGDELREWIRLLRQCECSIIMDEFYSHYIYSEDTLMISAAKYIDDVNQDPVIIVDGLTKNWRYPGWRISWIVGPKSIIETVSSTGSFLDGGANHPFQVATFDLLDPEKTMQETKAIHHLFLKKRDYVVERLTRMGIKVNAKPMGGFYVWADLSNLPKPINDSMAFFEEGLLEKVITVPGIFFDVNPGGRRIKHRRYSNYVRISFGPEMPVLERGLDALEKIVSKFQTVISITPPNFSFDQDRLD
jgi:aspartate/methionine/tyrosine aminotransferase